MSSPSNYNEQLQSMYCNMLLHQQSLAYANMMAALTSTPVASVSPTAAVKIEPKSPQKPSTSSENDSKSPSFFSLDTEIPREEIEGDIEVIMVRNFQDTLKKLDTTLNGYRGKKWGFREVLEMTQSRPTYGHLNSSFKRSRTLSKESLNATPKAVSEKSVKKQKIDKNSSVCDDSDASSDDGRLMIDWNESQQEEKPKIHIEKPQEEEFKPSKIRFERLKQMQKKKPRFNIDNLDLTYHSNMARNFPGTENRTSEQQQRRDKNTLAARISRNKNKAYEKLLEQQSLDATVENINLKRQVACLRVYANSLMKLTGMADTDFNKMWENNIKDLYSNLD